MSPDHYRTLGVGADATAADLRAAYLRLAKTYHPDGASGLSPAEADAKMAAINQAYAVIGDPRSRRLYDRDRTNQTWTGDSASTGPRYGNERYRPFDPDDDFVYTSRQDVDFDPTPIAGSKQLPRWITMAPVLLVAGAILSAGLAIMVDSPQFLALAAMIFVAGAAGFFIGPLLAMSRAERDPDL